MPRVSPEKTLVAWAKANSPIAALVSTRVATKLPVNPTMPFLRLFKVGGAPDSGEAPIDLPLIQFDCYGSDEATAETLERTLIEELEKLHTVHSSNSHGFLYGARVLASRRTPEPDTTWGRYTVEATVTVRNLT